MRAVVLPFAGHRGCASGTLRARRLVSAHRSLAGVLGLALVVVSCGEVNKIDRSPTLDSPSRPTIATPSSDPSSSPGQPERGSVAPATATTTLGSVDVRVSHFRLPSARSRSVAAAFGSRIMVIGGLTKSGTSGSILAIDVGAGTVQPVGTLTAPVHDAGGAILDAAIVVVGGGRSVPGAFVQRVSPSGDGTTIGRLPAARADLAAVSVGGRLLVVGGGTSAGPDDRVLATRDGRKFRTIARLAVGVRYPAVAVLDDLVYVIGGSTSSGDTDVIQLVDPSTGTVGIVGHLPKALSHAAALVVGGSILIAGGRSAGRAQDGLWRLDPSGGTATRIGRLPYGVSDTAAVVASGIGYLVGGERKGLLTTTIEISVR